MKQEEINSFVAEYDAWVKQDKYNGFGFPKIEPKWRKRLLENKKIPNLYAIIFGPLYLMFLGSISCIFLILLLILLLSFVFALTHSILGTVLAYFLINFLFSPLAKKAYIQKKKSFYNKMKDFSPDAVTHYLNISSARLIILTILSGGLYLCYWFYKNAKAIRTDQKDARIHPNATSIFQFLLSYEVFKPIELSLKLAEYPKRLNARLSAAAYLVVPVILNLIIQSFISKGIFPSYFRDVVYLIAIPIWLIISLMWLRGINFYAQKNDIPRHKSFSFGEVGIILLGFVGAVLSVIYFFTISVNWRPLEDYLVSTIGNVLEHKFVCADKKKPDFVLQCTVSSTPKTLTIKMKFDSYPQWLEFIHLREGGNLSIQKENVTFTF